MLKSKYRLKKRKEFAYIYRKGEATHSKYLTLVCVPSKLDTIHIGFSVSKKVGKAHYRNLIKRRLTEIVGNMISGIKPNYNYVLIAKDGIVDLTFSKLQSDVRYVFTKSGKYE